MSGKQTASKRVAQIASMILLYLAAVILSGSASANEYPDRPIRIIVPFSAGGGNDIIARIVGQQLSQDLGQPVIIENKPGASAIIGTTFVARQEADGYTLLMGASGNMTVNPAIIQNLSYSPKNDFASISMLASYPLVLVVDANSEIRSVKDFIKFSEQRPRDARYANPTNAFQIAAELFKWKTGASITSIPYRGGAEAVTAILSGQVTCAFLDVGSASSQIRSGSLRAIAITAKQRAPEYPDVPTLEEAGVSDAEITLWMGLFAPVGTPQPIVGRLRQAIHAALQRSSVRERITGLGINPAISTPEELAAIVARDIDRYSEIARIANIKVTQ